MANNDFTNISKFLSLILRHQPDIIGLTLDPQGWAFIPELIEKANPKIKLSREIIQQIVISSDNKRFTLSPDNQRIRANQGHSIQVDLGLPSVAPPSILYHGTASRFLDSINREGLKPGKRHHVHLSADVETAAAVGKRYGKSVILQIESRKMNNNGYKFFLSENGVWLTDCVSPEFLSRAT